MFASEGGFGEAEGADGAVFEGDACSDGGAPVVEGFADGDAGAAAEVEDFEGGRRLPAAAVEFGEDPLPFPCDAAGEGGVVGGEEGIAVPVVGGAGCAIEICFSESVQCRPVEVHLSAIHPLVGSARAKRSGRRGMGVNGQGKDQS